MKRMITLLFAICLAVGMAVPVFAEETDISSAQEPVPPVVGEPTIVSTLDELLEAISATEVGGTIFIRKEINLRDVSLITDKSIILSEYEGYNGVMFRIFDGTTISGFTFEQHSTANTPVLQFVNCSENPAEICDCRFEKYGDGQIVFIDVFGNFPDTNKVKISNCKFSNSTSYAISTKTNTDVIIDSCVISGTLRNAAGGAIYNNGVMVIKNSIITDNAAASGGGVLNSGDLTIENCKIYGNTTTSKLGTDIFSVGGSNLTLSFEQEDGAGYYNESTGEKIVSPIINSTEHIPLVYLTDEAAVDYFAPQESEDPVGPEPPTDLENPTEPENPDDTEKPDNSDQPADTEKPTDTEEADNQESPTESNSPVYPPMPQESPQEPPESYEKDDSDYTPSVSPNPIIKPIAPTEGTSEEPEAIANLVCGDAVIDCSRSAVLYGYGDGLLHEDDPLTRAQMATIIFRLLDEESTSKLSKPLSSFADVAADAWCAPYVLALADAGAVNGTGGGCYSPNSLATWGQFLTVLGRFVEPQECVLKHIQYDGWAKPAVETAVAHGWIEDSNEFDPTAVISRGAALDLLNTVLEMYR